MLRMWLAWSPADEGQHAPCICDVQGSGGHLGNVGASAKHLTHKGVEHVIIGRGLPVMVGEDDSAGAPVGAVACAWSNQSPGILIDATGGLENVSHAVNRLSTMEVMLLVP